MGLQAGSEIVPVWPLLSVRLDWEKRTVPKSVRGDWWQSVPDVVQAEGASAIHSAEVVSGAAMWRTRLKVVLRVRLRMATVTWAPETVTEALIRSPGVTTSSIGFESAGTSSYQAR